MIRTPTLKSSRALEEVHALVRNACPPMPEEHYLAHDIERAIALVFAGELARLMQWEGSIVVLP